MSVRWKDEEITAYEKRIREGETLSTEERDTLRWLRRTTGTPSCHCTDCINEMETPMPTTPKRVGDVDRNRYIDHLRVAYTDGFITREEFDERSTKALTARVLPDLIALISDLNPIPAITVTEARVAVTNSKKRKPLLRRAWGAMSVSQRLLAGVPFTILLAALPVSFIGGNASAHSVPIGGAGLAIMVPTLIFGIIGTIALLASAAGYVNN